jgi:hypothetical protein
MSSGGRFQREPERRAFFRSAKASAGANAERSREDCVEPLSNEALMSCSESDRRAEGHEGEWILSEEPSLSERDSFALTDNNVIEHSHIYEGQRILQRLGYALICLTRLGYAGRQIVCRVPRYLGLGCHVK